MGRSADYHRHMIDHQRLFLAEMMVQRENPKQVVYVQRRVVRAVLRFIAVLNDAVEDVIIRPGDSVQDVHEMPTADLVVRVPRSAE